MTEPQFLSGEKSVTRRLGWSALTTGTRLLAVRKAMGLRKGEKQHSLGEIEVVRVDREPLHAIAQYDDDCAREGFPNMSPNEFVAMFCKHMGCKPATLVTRIEFRKCAQ
jgi:hypothetical protein